MTKNNTETSERTSYIINITSLIDYTEFKNTLKIEISIIIIDIIKY